MEISNYYFWKSVIRDNRMTPTWKNFNLRVGWFGVVYTVINLPPEVFESEEMYHKVYVLEQMKPINSFLADKNVSEIITPTIMKIPQPKPKGEDDEVPYIAAFLVTYSPVFKDFNFRWLFKYTLILGGLVWAQIKFDLIEKLTVLITWFSKLF